MIHLILHGRLRKLAPEGLWVDVATAAEAILAMSHALAKDLMPTPARPRQTVCIPGYEVDQDFYTLLPPEVTELHIVPVMMGGKGGGILQMVVGAVLIVVGVIVGIWAGWTGVGGTVAYGLISMGIGMMLGGVLAMLSPGPKPFDTPKIDMEGRTASLYAGRPRNTTKIGTRIPICYGRYRLYGHILSSDIQATEVAV